MLLDTGSRRRCSLFARYSSPFLHEPMFYSAAHRTPHVLLMGRVDPWRDDVGCPI